MGSVVAFPVPRRDAPVSDPLPEPDFTLSDCGSLIALKPLNDAAKAWLAENLPSNEGNWWCGALAIEPRYISLILAGIADAGLVAR